MSRFDHDPEQPRGECLDCGITLQDKAEQDAHQDAVLAEAPEINGRKTGHRIRVTNPTRPARIERYVLDKIQEALEGALQEIDDRVGGDELTEEEVKTALRHAPEAEEIWDEDFMGAER